MNGLETPRTAAARDQRWHPSAVALHSATDAVYQRAPVMQSHHSRQRWIDRTDLSDAAPPPEPSGQHTQSSEPIPPQFSENSSPRPGSQSAAILFPSRRSHRPRGTRSVRTRLRHPHSGRARTRLRPPPSSRSARRQFQSRPLKAGARSETAAAPGAAQTLGRSASSYRRGPRSQPTTTGPVRW